jgi:hypothetical protein
MKFTVLDGKEIGLSRVLRNLIPVSLFLPSRSIGRPKVEIEFQKLLSEPLGKRNVDLVVLVPESTVLRRVMRFPTAAEVHLENAIAIQLRKDLPGDGADFFWTHHVVVREKGKISVEVLIARKNILDEIKNKASKNGCVLVQVNVLGGSTKPLWFANSEESSKLNRWIMASIIVATCIALISVLILESRVREVNSAIQSLELSNSELEKVAAASADFPNAVSLQNSDFYLRRFNQGARAVAYISDIDAILEGEGWISQIEIGNGNIRLAAFSEADVPSIIESLRILPWVVDVQLNGPVVRDSYLGQNRFEVTIALEAQ